MFDGPEDRIFNPIGDPFERRGFAGGFGGGPEERFFQQ